MTAAAYIPQPGSIAARALAHLQTLPDGVEIASGPLADALGITSNIVNVSLNSAAKHGVLVRDKRHDRIYWKLGPNVPLPGAPLAAAAPPPEPARPADPHEEADDDAAPIARTFPVAAAEPLAGLMQQSWCPAAQTAGAESSLDELPDEPMAHAPMPPAPKPPGLDWKAPPVSAPRPADAAGAEASDVVLQGLEHLHAETVRKVTAPTVDDDTARELSAALAPSMPAWLDGLDPDFREVERTPPTLPLHVGAEFHCALWTTGVLEMQLASGTLVRLTPGETKRLVNYLERMAETAE
jgi:hypothetical protein